MTEHAARPTTREMAAALPGLVRLLWRLVRDPRVDRRRRWLAMGAAAYAVVPARLPWAARRMVER